MNNRQSYYDKTGRCPRTMKEAFGPYTHVSPPAPLRPVVSDQCVFVAACVVAVILVALLVWGIV
jgi:hypothetical protein